MKTLLVILVVAAVAIGGWFAFKHHRAATAPAPLTDAFAPDAPGGPGSASASAPTLAAPALPPAASQALAQADALWSQAGADPLHSAKVPELSRRYTLALRALYNAPGFHGREDELVRDRLQPLAEALFFSKTPFNDDPAFATHVVAAKESPELIAKKYGMSREFLNRLRGREPNDGKLNAGDSLKVVRLAAPAGTADAGLARGFQIHIDKGDFLMDVAIDGMFARRYTVSHGSEKTPTPTGATHVVNRVWHPDWTHPVTHQVIRYGEPDHLLGPIWLPFDAKELGRSGIGIHGFTGADAKWGAQVSNGCIRLHNEAAVELYELLGPPERAPIAVEIVE